MNLLSILIFKCSQAHGFGFGIGLIFFGCECLLDGWPIVKSGYSRGYPEVQDADGYVLFSGRMVDG